MKYHETIRKNLIMTKNLYMQSLAISEEIGLTYPDYIRMLIAQDIRSRRNEKLEIKRKLNSTKPQEEMEKFEKDFNNLPWSTKSTTVKNGFSWKGMLRGFS